MAADANVCPRCGHSFNGGQYSMPPLGPSQTPRFGPSNYTRPDYDEPSNVADVVAILSLVFGILALPLICACYLSIPCGILAMIFGGFGLRSRNRSVAIAGMICAGIAILISAIMLIAFLSMGSFRSSIR